MNVYQVQGYKECLSIVKTDQNHTYLNQNLYKWRRARVVFTPKVGGRVVSLPKSFGLISLTFFLFKSMEKAVDKNLITRDWHPRQHVYRAGSSTETALASWVDGDTTEIFRWERDCSMCLHWYRRSIRQYPTRGSQEALRKKRGRWYSVKMDGKVAINQDSWNRRGFR